MNSADIGLEDIITPAGVSYWPPAPGWWLLALAVAAITALGICGMRRYRRQWGYRNQGLRLLRQCYRQWQQHHNDDRACRELLSILKRVAITACPQEQTIANRHGKAWLDFLNAQTKTPVFGSNEANAIIVDQYKKDPDINITALYQGCQRWIRQHRTKPKTGA